MIKRRTVIRKIPGCRGTRYLLKATIPPPPRTPAPSPNPLFPPLPPRTLGYIIGITVTLEVKQHTVIHFPIRCVDGRVSGFALHRG